MNAYRPGGWGVVGQVPVGRWFLMNGRFFRRLDLNDQHQIEDPISLLDARTGQPSISHQNVIVVQLAGGGIYFAECSDECEFLEPKR